MRRLPPLGRLTPCATFALVFGACGRAKSPAAVEAGDVSVSGLEGGAVSSTGWADGGFGPALPAAPRCAPGAGAAFGQAAAADGPGGRSDFEVGDAVPFAGGYAIAVGYRGDHGRMAAVALAAANGEGNLRLVDLGASLGDAPPPRLALRPAGLVAAAYARHESRPTDAADNGRSVAFYSVSPERGAVPLFEVGQQRDDSFAFDVAYASDGKGGVTIWDEAAGAGRGAVRFAALSTDDRVGPAHDLSAPESDAELPRIFAGPSGYTALWIARRPEPTASDGGEVETPGEARTFGWIEAAELDEHAALAGPVRRLTPPGGHIAAFDAQRLSGENRGTLLVAARDDGEGVDGSGGVLLRIRVTATGPEPPVAFPTDGLGRGSPSLVGGDPPLLAWTGPREQLRLLPLDRTGAPAGPFSAEDAMSEGRPLLLLRSGDEAGRAATSAAGAAALGRLPWDGGGRLLVATPLDKAALLRTFVCRELRAQP